MKWRTKTVLGSLMKTPIKKALCLCTLKMTSGYSAPKGTPDEESQEENPRKEDQKVLKEEEKEKDPDFAPGLERQKICTL